MHWNDDGRETHEHNSDYIEKNGENRRKITYCPDSFRWLVEYTLLCTGMTVEGKTLKCYSGYYGENSKNKKMIYSPDFFGRFMKYNLCTLE